MYSYIVPVLPYIDNQELFNQWQMFYPGYVRVSHLCPSHLGDTTKASNFQIGNTSIGIFVCPDDTTIRTGQGNLELRGEQWVHARAGIPAGLVGQCGGWSLHNGALGSMVAG